MINCLKCIGANKGVGGGGRGYTQIRSVPLKTNKKIILRFSYMKRTNVDYILINLLNFQLEKNVNIHINCLRQWQSSTIILKIIIKPRRIIYGS